MMFCVTLPITSTTSQTSIDVTTFSGVIDTDAIAIRDLQVASSLSATTFPALTASSPNLGPGSETHTIDPPGFDPPYDVTVSFDDLFVFTALEVTISDLLVIPDFIPINPSSLTAYVGLFDYSAHWTKQVTVDGQTISPVDDSYSGTVTAAFAFTEVPGPGLEEITVERSFGSSIGSIPSGDEIATELGLPFFPDYWSNENFPTNAPYLGVTFSGWGQGSFSSEIVPEPSTALLLASGLAGLAVAGRRRA